MDLESHGYSTKTGSSDVGRYGVALREQIVMLERKRTRTRLRKGLVRYSLHVQMNEF